MGHFVANVTLLVCLGALILIWLILAVRRRVGDRRRQSQERLLILQALTGAAAPPTPTAAPTAATPAPANTQSRPSGPASPLDAASIVTLLEYLDGRQPRRGDGGGLLAALNPKGIWLAAERAGQTTGRRTMDAHPDLAQAEPAPPSSDLYREAAEELVEIHRRDPDAAHQEFLAYAAAIGDETLAQLYVRAAAHNVFPNDTEQARHASEAITGTALHNAAPSNGSPQKVSQADVSIDT